MKKGQTAFLGEWYTRWEDPSDFDFSHCIAKTRDEAERIASAKAKAGPAPDHWRTIQVRWNGYRFEDVDGTDWVEGCPL